jgi:hypothetical protein
VWTTRATPALRRSSTIRATFLALSCVSLITPIRIAAEG